MKKQIKGFIAGVVTTAILMNGTAIGLGFKQNIEVLFNSVNLKVNGKPIQADNIVYDGTTYVPLRKTAEMLGKDVEWDSTSNSINITEKMSTKSIVASITNLSDKYFESQSGGFKIKFPRGWTTEDKSTNSSASIISYKEKNRHPMIIISLSEYEGISYKMLDVLFDDNWIYDSFKNFYNVKRIGKSKVQLGNAEGLLLEYSGNVDVDGEKLSKHIYVVFAGENDKLYNITAISNESDWNANSLLFMDSFKSFVVNETTKTQQNNIIDINKLSENDVKAKLKRQYSTLKTIDFSVYNVEIQQSTAKSLGFSTDYDEEVAIRYEIDEDDYLEWIRLDRETKKEWLKSIYEFLIENYEYPDKAIYFSIGYQHTYHSYPSSFEPSDISIVDDGFLVTTTIATFNNFNGDIDIDLE